MANTGYQQVKVLLQKYADDKTSTGIKMPNIAKISPQAIVPGSATITYNQSSNVTPTGGADGDIWYNLPADTLFKNFTGTWVLLTDRVTNNAYIAPVYNITSCPL